MKLLAQRALYLWIALVLTGLLTPRAASAEDDARRARRRAAEAESRTPRTKATRRKPRRVRPPRAPRDTRAPREKRLSRRRPKSSTPITSATPTSTHDASGIVRDGDTSVKVMRFGELDIEGRLKSPQLVYFVERVRAEFAHPRLPHRSFLPEVRDSTMRKPIR